MAKLERRQIEFPAVSPIDWAYLAGIMDGEGCITIKAVSGHRNKGTGRFSLVVHACNTDTRLISWLRDKFGGYVHYSPPTKSKHRPAWVWRTQSTRSEAILRGCLPFMIVKKEQAEIALSFCETLRMVTACRSGVPPHIIELRQGYKDQLAAMKRRSYPPVKGVLSKHLKADIDETIQ